AKSSAGTASAELDGVHHALAADGDARDAAGDLLLEIGDVLHVLAVDRDDHVARPHEAAGIGARLDLDDDDAVAVLDQAELVGDGGGHVDDAGAGERLGGLPPRGGAPGGPRGRRARGGPWGGAASLRSPTTSLPPRITFTGTIVSTVSVASRKRRLASSSIGRARRGMKTAVRLIPVVA